MRRMLPCGPIWIALALVSGCATYHPKPLPTAPDLTSLRSLTVPANRLALPELKPHRFDPSQGLDETTVIALAVFNNPDLKAARKRAGVARAQLLEAGLLPDPQVSGDLSYSTLHTGYSVGLSEDLRTLITRGAAKSAAKAHAKQINIEILWQEWQVAQKARNLFIQARANNQLRRVLIKTRGLFANRYHQDEAALKRNLITADTVSGDLASLTTAETQLRRVQLQINRTRHALDRLLGLKPDVGLRLIGRDDSRPLSAEQFQSAIAALPHRRADLLALQAGYQSQEERVREAILAQFPSLSAGIKQARSAEEGIHTIGFAVSLSLPLFNRNRGRIAIQRATRALLYQTYQARLDQAVSQADQIWHATRIMARQSRKLDEQLPTLVRMAKTAKGQLEQGNLDAAAYTGMESNLLSAQAEAIRLHALLGKAQAALDMLLGLPFDGHVGPKK